MDMFFIQTFNCNVYVTKTIDGKYYYSGNHIHFHEVDEKYAKREKLQEGIDKVLSDIGQKKKINVTEEATNLIDNLNTPHINTSNM